MSIANRREGLIKRQRKQRQKQKARRGRKLTDSLSRMISSWCDSQVAIPTTLARSSRRLAAENLEARRLLAVSVADLTVNEGIGTASIVVTNSPPSPVPVSFDISTNGNTATGGQDYRIRFATLTIPANQSTVNFDVDILDDTNVENSEQFGISVTNVVGSTLADGQAFVTILDNDSGGDSATLLVQDVTVNEDAATAAVTVSLSQSVPTPVTVLAATGTGTATTNQDFLPSADFLTFNPGVLTQTLLVPILNDTDVEPTETISVSLSNATNAAIDDGTGIVTIIDDDGGGATQSELVGVDFSPLGTNSPTNWTRANGNVNFALNNLIDESGASTNIDLSIAFDAGAGLGTFGSSDPAFLPAHSNPLTGIGGVVVDQTGFTFTFGGLNPGAPYDVFVFGGDVINDVDNIVTITGQTTVGPFTQNSNNGDIVINRQVTSAAPLDSFAEVVLANASGEIVITANGTTGTTVIDGLAIRESVSAPPVAQDELIGVDFSRQGTTSPTNWTRAEGNSDFSLTNLIDETGATTNVGLDIRFDGGTATGQGTFPSGDPADLPTHSNPLTGIGGVIVDQSGITFTFSNLDPQVDYEVFVFGGDVANGFDNMVTISGETSVGPFNQLSETGDIVINRLVTSTAPLDSFAETVLSDVNGNVVIRVAGLTGTTVVDGLAIRRVSADQNVLVSVDNLVIDEQDATGLINVRLDAPSTETITATILSVDGTAQAGLDFDLIFDTVTFLPGETSQTIPVSIIDDGEIEQTETFSVTIASVVGTGALAGPNATVTITDTEFRTIDGTRNQPDDAGAADTRLIRFGYPHGFVDSIGDDISELTTEGLTANPSFALPNARDISNALFVQDESIESDRNLTDWIVQWGQFVTHDLSLTTNGAQFNQLSTGEIGDFNIPVQPGDPLGPGPIPFNRSNFDPTTGNSTLRPNGEDNSREQINDITSFIDASNVYGSDPVRAAALRTFSGGRLIMSAGDLPGFNDAGLPNDNATGLPENELFLTGDVRANEQIGLTAVHTLFTREHNRLADLIAQQNPSFTDEEIYQWARRIVGAQMQIITYEEFLPALIGDQAPDPFAVVDRQVDPSITNSFANAFFRFGHSMQSPEIQLVDNNDQSVGSLSLRDAFFQPSLLVDDPNLIDLTLKGLASQTAQENDIHLVDDIRNFLFGPPGAGGLDLGALDLQRGRDHGLLSFNEFRLNYGLPRINSFAELTSDPELQAQLEAIYGDINHVEAFVGGLAEDHVPGTSLGSLLIASFTDQFSRLRDGDEFFYSVDPLLQDPIVTGVIDLGAFQLSDVIRANTNVTNIQDNVFFGTSTISGTSWLDLNGDSVRDSDESPVAGATIFVDDNLNGSFDPGEPSAVTDSDGFYEIDGLLAGQHVVSQVVPPGFQTTFPVPPATGHTVTLDTGINATEIDFGNQPLAGTSFDFGDAPLPFPVTRAENGAQHAIVSSVVGPSFGSVSADPTLDGVHSPLAQGDTFDDGVAIGNLHPGTNNNQVVLTISGTSGIVDGWIDFNLDGDWDDPLEKIIDSVSFEQGTHEVVFSVPSDALVGDAISRFRISSVGGLSPTGAAFDGEVEDHLAAITPLPQLSISNASASENETVSFDVSLSEPTDREVVFSATTTNATAEAPDDFVGLSNALFTIPAGEQNVSVDVSVLSDSVLEPTEFFNVQISGLVNAELGNATALGEIIDNSLVPVATLSFDNLSISENGGLTTATVSLGAVSALDTTIGLTFTGTASAGQDYSGVQTQVVIPAGLSQAQFNVAALNDDFDELNETIVVELTSFTNASPAAQTQQTITIVDDDDPPVATTEIDNLAISENGETTTLTITLAAPNELDSSFQLSLAGTATVDVDYNISATLLSIPAGETTASVTLTSIDNDLFEDNRTIEVGVLGPGLTSQTLNISIEEDDPEPSVSLSVDPDTINELDGSATITATLDAVAPVDTIVNLAFTGVDESDFSAANTITIAQGQLSASVEIAAVDDDQYERDETLLIDVQDVSTGFTVITEQLSVVIADDDFGAFAVTAASDPIDVNESGTTSEIAVVLTVQPFDNVIVQVTSSDIGEATVSIESLTFTPENWNEPQTVIVSGVGDFPEDGDVGFEVSFSVDENSDEGFVDLEPIVAAGVNTNVPLTNLIVQSEEGLIVVRNQDTGTIIEQDASQGSTSIEIDLSDTARFLQVGLFGDFAGIIDIEHQDDDTLEYGDGWTAALPEFIDGRFTHIIQRDDATLHVVNDAPHQNPFNVLDANRDGSVTALDALVGINFIESNGTGALPVPVQGEPVAQFYYDVSGDQQITALDSLQVINGLERLSSTASGEPESEFVSTATIFGAQIIDAQIIDAQIIDAQANETERSSSPQSQISDQVLKAATYHFTPAVDGDSVDLEGIAGDEVETPEQSVDTVLSDWLETSFLAL